MTRSVFDTNVLVSAGLFPLSVPRRAVQYATLSGLLLMSANTYSELQAVLSRDKFARYASLSSRLAYLDDLAPFIELVVPTLHVQICRDVDDDKFLALAASAGAEYLITGDDDLLVLHPFGSVQILSPADYLRLA